MNVLSAKLQSKLESRPTNTMLRSETIQDTDQNHTTLLKSADIPRMNIKIPRTFD